MLPIKPKFDVPASVMDGATPLPPLRTDPVRLDSHFPKVPQNANAMVRLAAQAPGQRMLAGHWMPTLVQQHQAKVAATPSAQLVVAHTDVNGRFIDGSGRADVGPPDFDEFPVLRVLGRKAVERLSNTVMYGLGLLDWFNPTGVIPTPEARYAMKRTHEDLVSTAGFVAEMVVAPIQTLSGMVSAPLHALDEADELSRQGRSAQAAELRGEVVWGLLLAAFGHMKLVKAKPIELETPNPQIDLVRSIQRREPDDIDLRVEGMTREQARASNFYVYEYQHEAPYGTFMRSRVVDGTLKNSVHVNPAFRPVYGGGADLFDALLLRLWGDGIAVNRVNHLWLEGSDNYLAYANNLKRGMTREQAAAQTWSGAYWGERGFGKVRIPYAFDDPSRSFDNYVVVDMTRD